MRFIILLHLFQPILLNLREYKLWSINYSVTLLENLNSTIRFVQQVRKSSNITIIVGGNAIKFASKSQIELLEKFDKVYFDLEKLDDIINNVKVLMNIRD